MISPSSPPSSPLSADCGGVTSPALFIYLLHANQSTPGGALPFCINIDGYGAACVCVCLCRGEGAEGAGLLKTLSLHHQIDLA